MDDTVPAVVTVEEPVEPALFALQRAILLHPVAAQALFRAMVEEGRRYSNTEDGGELQERLASSELAIQARVFWDALTVRSLEDDPSTIVPTAVLDAIVKAATDQRLSGVLEDLFRDNVLSRGAP